jgi:hypothetical protein
MSSLRGAFSLSRFLVDDYKKIAKRAVPTVPAFATEYYYFSRDYADAPQVGETTLIFANSRRLTLAGTNTKLKVSAKIGFATAGKQGHLYEVHDTADATKSRAIFLQEDKQMFEVTRDSAGKFTVLGSLLP